MLRKNLHGVERTAPLCLPGEPEAETLLRPGPWPGLWRVNSVGRFTEKLPPYQPLVSCQLGPPPLVLS